MRNVQKFSAPQAEVVCDPSVMGGEPVIKGTRIPAETILAYIRGDHTVQEIFEDYPGLPLDGIDAVVRWAEKSYGSDWKAAEAIGSLPR